MDVTLIPLPSLHLHTFGFGASSFNKLRSCKKKKKKIIFSCEKFTQFTLISSDLPDNLQIQSKGIMDVYGFQGLDHFFWFSFLPVMN